MNKSRQQQPSRKNFWSVSASEHVAFPRNLIKYVYSKTIGEDTYHAEKDLSPIRGSDRRGADFRLFGAKRRLCAALSGEPAGLSAGNAGIAVPVRGAAGPHRRAPGTAERPQGVVFPGLAAVAGRNGPFGCWAVCWQML